MTLPPGYQEIVTGETCREAVFLVSRMMRYRMDTIAGLEEEVREAMEEIHACRNLKKFQRSAKRLGHLLERIRNLALDNQYDAVHLAAILRFWKEECGDIPGRAGDDPVRYIT